MTDPVFDADINIAGSLKLFQQCVKYKVKKVIFASSGGAGEAFNIGTGIETDVNELAEKLGNLIESKSELKHGPAKAGEQKRSVISPVKAKKHLNWKPAVSFDDGLRRTVQYHRIK